MNKEDLQAIAAMMKSVISEELKPVKDELKVVKDDLRILKEKVEALEMQKHMQGDISELKESNKLIQLHLKSIDERSKSMEEILGRHEVEIHTLRRRPV